MALGETNAIVQSGGGSLDDIDIYVADFTDSTSYTVTTGIVLQSARLAYS